MDELDLDDTNLLDGLNAQDETEIEAGDEVEGDDPEVGAGDEEGVGNGQDGRTAQDGNERSGRVRRPASETIREQRSRAQAAEQRAQDAERRAEALERVLAERNQQPDPQAIARQQAEEAERVAMMDPAQVAQYYANKSAHMLQQQMQASNRQQLDALDRIEFRGLAASNKTAARFADEVEQIVSDQAKLGYSIKREEALKYAIGKAVLAGAGKASKTQKPAAQARVAANTTRRVTPGGDMGREGDARGDTKAALMKRLANVNI